MEMLQKPVVCEAVKKKEEGASFIRTNLTNFFTSLIQAPVEQTIRPVEHDPERMLRLNPDEIAAYVPPYRLAA
ncbi:hypothetical protein Poly59_39600 [Rubripirellula reticaptiva]|uniref:Uncharacterized protein n=2 Tax=Rubripirellula reticaptiva TaxID=2528013 RepID=A0A5C6EP01_9BACT|nr:hypothetical protein Poly59_39600 [Rubripirellula reticaptiva]